MVIANLNYLDSVSQKSEIIGGDALAVATAGSFAFGRFFATSGTDTRTVALDLRRFGNIAASRSVSIAAAA